MKLLAIDIKTYFFNGGQIGPSSTQFQSLTGVSSLVSAFLRGAFALAGLILLFYFIMGGIAMIGSAGKDDPKAAAGAKASITTALIGFMVVFTAYWIVNLLGKLLFNVTNFI